MYFFFKVALVGGIFSTDLFSLESRILLVSLTSKVLQVLLYKQTKIFSSTLNSMTVMLSGEMMLGSLTDKRLTKDWHQLTHYFLHF